MMEPLTIKVDVTKDDLLELRHDTHENVTTWGFYIVSLWLLSLIPGDAKFVLMGLAALLFAKLELGRHRSIDKSLRLWADVGESTYAFGEPGVRVTHSKGERQYDWSTLTSFRDHKSALLLYYLDLQSLFIPKRCLQEGEIDRIHEFLKHSRNLTQEENRKRKRSDRILFSSLAVVVAILVCVIIFGDDIAMWLFRIRN